MTKFGGCKNRLQQPIGRCERLFFYNMGDFLQPPFGGCKTRIYNLSDFLQLPFDGCKTRIYNMGDFLQPPFGGCKTRVYNMGDFSQPPFGRCKIDFLQRPFTTTIWWL